MTDQFNDDIAPHELQDAEQLPEMQQSLTALRKLSQANDEEGIEEGEEEETVEEDEYADGEEEETEEAPEEEASKTKKTDKPWKVKKLNHRLMHEKKTIMAENAHLKKMLEEALNSSTNQFEKNAQTYLLEAKARKKAAIEDGDVDALIEADIMLGNALDNIKEINQWSAANSIPKAASEDQQRIYIEQNIANDWIEGHEELQADSESYDKALASKVSNFINKLDNSLTTNQRQDLYYSEEYFEAIDDFIERTQQKKANVSKRNNMVGSVRSGKGGSSASPSVSGKLSKIESILAENMGVSSAEWLKQKHILSKTKRG